MDEIRVPIYLITGFLESGKTTFLRFTPVSYTHLDVYKRQQYSGMVGAFVP